MENVNNFGSIYSSYIETIDATMEYFMTERIEDIYV